MEEPESVRIDLGGITQLQPSTLHRLPCKIHCDGYAPVAEMFPCEPLHSEAKETHFVATFRGRKLLGEKFCLPKDTIGFVVPKDESASKSKDVEEEGERKLEASAWFNSLTSWNHDMEPSDRDAMRGWMEWIEMSAALHQPVE